MSLPRDSLLLLAGRLGVHNDGWSIRPLLDRLERLGLTVQVICIDAVGDAVTDDRVIVCPGLGRRLGKSLGIRGLRLGERINRPDLLHVLESRLSELGLAIAEHWRLPYVQTIDEFLPAGGRLRMSRSWCRRLIAASRELAEDLTSQFGVPATGLTVVNPGIEALAVDRPLAAKHPVAVIGTAGSLVGTSGFGTFLNAARHVIDAGIDAEFVIAGRGEDEVDLRRRADRLKITGRVTFAGIPLLGLRFWDVLDLYCQPSLIPTVGRPLATAQAFGVPSIASDLGGLRALINHESNGLLVPPGDSEALARAILRLLGDTEQAHALGRQGRAEARRDSHPDLEARALLEVYRDALPRTSGERQGRPVAT